LDIVSNQVKVGMSATLEILAFKALSVTAAAAA
jgi:hypothetical protein